MKANVYDEGRVPHVPQLNAVGKPRPPQTRVPAKAGSAKWLVAALLLLSAIPLTAGAFRLSELAGGHFEYTENGVLDVTHVRFFTRASLRDLFGQTGFEVRRITPLTQPAVIDPVVVHRRPGRLDTRTLSIRYRSFDDLEDLYALQYVVDARATGSSASVAG